jgi:osmotically-inducible protein OsmY
MQATMKTTTTGGLADRISAALATNPYVPARKVMFEEEAGTIVLKGQVDSFFQKQMAQEALRRVDGVQTIENLLEVSWA